MFMFMFCGCFRNYVYSIKKRKKTRMEGSYILDTWLNWNYGFPRLEF